MDSEDVDRIGSCVDDFAEAANERRLDILESERIAAVFKCRRGGDRSESFGGFETRIVG